LKRFFAILLLSVHLFSIGGYAFLFQYYIHQADIQVVKKVYDDNITNTKFVEIKIPVHYPKIANWSDYQPVEGEVQLKGIYYSYVRLKMTRDTMYFIGLPSTTQPRLVKTTIIDTKKLNDFPLGKTGHESSFKKINIFSEYNLQAFLYNYSAFGIFLKHSSKPVNIKLDNPFTDSAGKPPNFVA